MSRTIGTVLLIIGVTVGTAMLALPVALAKLGFALSLFLFIVIYGLMTYTALLTLEVNLWFPAGANFVSMTQKLFGKKIAVGIWVLYLFLFYSYLAAFLTGGGTLFTFHLHSHIKHLPLIPNWSASLIWLLLFASILFIGVKSADYFNRVLMLGLVVCLLLFAGLALPHVNFNLLTGGNISDLLAATPVVLTAFTFQFIIPSLRVYLNSNFAKLRFAILVGASCLLLIYCVWMFLLFAIIPYKGSAGFSVLLAEQNKVAVLMIILNWNVGHPLMALLIRLLGIFAIATTFMCVALSLYDFLADSFKIVKNVRGKLLLLLLVFLPPYFYTLFFPESFIANVLYTGILSTLLFGILPIIMAWTGRYIKQMSFGRQIVGGRFWLMSCLLCFAIVFYFQIKHF